MKKVGILTFQWFDNYGSSLQAYGLQSAIKHLGHDAHIVPLKIHERRGWLRILSKSFRGLCENIRKYMVDHGSRRHAGYARFRKEHFDYGGRAPMFFDAALRYSFKEDTLIWGSDNIWSPWCVPLKEPMGAVFWGYGIHHPHKIVYAASTAGYLSDHPECRSVMRMIADAGFASVSLREKANCELFKKMSNVDIPNTPDPAFLLTQNQWSAIEKKPEDMEDDPFVFGYDLGHRGRVTVREGCEKIAAEIHVSVKIPYPKRFWKDRDIACFPGPSEWLWLIHHAQAVVTNSFHGVMFSIVYNRPFIFVSVQGEDESLSMRANEVLKAVGLERRVLSVGADVTSTMNEFIDWASVNERVMRLRKVGLAYLVDNI